MKTTAIFFIFILLGAISSNAQEITQTKRAWFDLQIAQHFGFNDWNRVKFASDRLPRTSFSTDLRATLNINVVQPVGVFCDMGVNILPAPRNGLSDPASQATLTTGIPHYTKEMIVENGYQTAKANFKMTFGLFGKIPAADKLSLSPYFGIGVMTISAPTCEAILKEHGTNMQYIARYQWFGQSQYSSNIASLNFLTFRLRFTYNISPKRNLLFGIEYTWYFNRADFSEIYTNYFNHNIVRTINHEGHRLNMLGLSLGISL